MYLPLQVESAVFPYPLLCCDIDNVDAVMLHWHDAERPHAFYDLTKDAEKLTRRVDIHTKIVFSQVAHYPPPKKLESGGSQNKSVIEKAE